MNEGYIIEDHLPAQQWLTQALRGAYEQIEVSLASNLEEAHRLLDRGYPHIALVDLNLPDGSGIEIIERINREAPGCITVVATIYDDDEHLFPALRAGAKGYVLKEQRREEIAALLAGIARGEPPISPSISQRLISYFSEQPERKQTEQKTLTKREREVLANIARGDSLNTVAERLGITRNTVASQVKSIYNKLNISSRAEAALHASRMGIMNGV